VAVASQRLKRLERELGVRLLHRTTRRLHPTPEGLALAREGRPLVEELALLGDRLRQRGGEVAGTLRVTAPASFGRQYIAPLMAGFLARHPGLRVSLDLDARGGDLIGAGYDLATGMGRLTTRAWSRASWRPTSGCCAPPRTTCAGAASRPDPANWPRTTACCRPAATAGARAGA